MVIRGEARQKNRTTVYTSEERTDKRNSRRNAKSLLPPASLDAIAFAQARA
jgi:hypothetical protein